MFPRKKQEPHVGPNMYAGSWRDGNYVWAIALHLAWNDMCSTVFGGPPSAEPAPSGTTELVEVLNRAPFTRKDVDEESVYVDVGFGPSAVDRINREVHSRFPTRSFPDLSRDIDDQDLVLYAYLSKALDFDTPFKPKSVAFEDVVDLEGFCAVTEEQSKCVVPILYESDDRFVVRLRLKGPADALYLVKGFPMDQPGDAVEATNREEGLEPPLRKQDKFSAPKITMRSDRNIPELKGLALQREGSDVALLSEIRERVSFMLDAKGARVETEVLLEVATMALGKRLPETPRHFYLDAPFWVVLKRAGAAHPYFVLGVTNAAWMMKHPPQRIDQTLAALLRKAQTL
jgi:hypothetical protein